MSITIDASTPAPLQAVGTVASPLASNSFTPPANSLVLVGISAAQFGGIQQYPVASVSDGTNTYTALNSAFVTNAIASGLHFRYYASSPGAITASVTWQTGNLPTQGTLLTVIVLNGCASVQTGAAVGVPVASCGKNATTTVTCTSAGTAPVVVGAGVKGPGVPANASITAVSAGVSFTLSAAATDSNTDTLTIGGYQVGASGLTPSVSVTTTANGSWVFAQETNFSSATAPTIPGGQTNVFNSQTMFETTSGNGYWTQATTAPTSASGTVVTINDTAPTGLEIAMVAAEILTGAAAPSMTGFIPSRMPIGV